MNVAQRHGIIGFDWLFVGGMVAATWLICWVSYLLIEVRGHQLIKWLQKGRPQRPTIMEPAAP
jgi:peptidoglycan/LPS O-acetylase OafA/YrhL